MWVQSLGRKDPLEKSMGAHSSISCLEKSTNRGAWRPAVHGAAKSQTRMKVKEESEKIGLAHDLAHDGFRCTEE